MTKNADIQLTHPEFLVMSCNDLFDSGASVSDALRGIARLLDDRPDISLSSIDLLYDTTTEQPDRLLAYYETA